MVSLAVSLTTSGTEAFCFSFASKALKLLFFSASKECPLIVLALVIQTEDRTELLVSIMLESDYNWEIRAYRSISECLDYGSPYCHLTSECGIVFACVLSTLWLCSMACK